jgi:cytochrome c oxidase subunit 3
MNATIPAPAPEPRIPSQKILLWVAMVSMAMLFAGLTSAYIVTQSDNLWVRFSMPQMFLLSTALILTGSFTIHRAVRAAKSGEHGTLKKSLVLTFILGIGFTASQYLAWQELVKSGNFFVSRISDLKGEYGKDFTIAFNGQDLEFKEGKYYLSGNQPKKEPISGEMFNSFNRSSSFLYVLTGLHIVHLAGGIIYLFIVLLGALRLSYAPGKTLPVELCATYWHFLDFLWIYLYLFLLFIR